MNKMRLEITDKLNLVALVPCIVNGAYPDTTIEVKNWKDFKDYTLELILMRDNVSSKAVKLKEGKCLVATNELVNATEIHILISNKTSTSEIKLDLKGMSYEATVFQNETTMGYLKLFNSMLEYIEDLDARVQQLEIDTTKELL